VNESKCVYITWRALDDDVNSFFGRRLGKELLQLTRRLKFLLVLGGDRVEQNGNLLVVVVVWNLDLPEGEFVCSNVVKLGCLFGLDFVFELTDCLGRVDHGRK
jgi:hypothetical protein